MLQVGKAQSAKKGCVLQRSRCKQSSPLQFQVTQKLFLASIPQCSETQYPFVHLLQFFSQTMSNEAFIPFMLASAQVITAFTPISFYSLLLYLLNTVVTMKGVFLRQRQQCWNPLLSSISSFVFNSNAKLKAGYKASYKVHPQDLSDYWTSEPVNSHKFSRDQCLVYALCRSADSTQVFLPEEATVISGALIDFFSIFLFHSVVLCPLCADAWQYALCLGNQLAKKTTNSQPNVSHRAQSISGFLLLRCVNNFHLFLCEIKI